MKRPASHKGFTLLSVLLLCLILQGIVTAPPVAHALYPDMEMNATPNPVGSGARAMGMGGAFIGVADDATAASWNPGGLLQLTRPEVSVVGSCFSGRARYKDSGIEGDIDDDPAQVWHLNYLSMVIPFMLLKRNFIFSLNYQHLYEFSQESYSTYREYRPGVQNSIDILHWDRKQQKGSLSTISPALAVQVTPSLFLGATFNFWDRGILDNGWENLTVQDSEGRDQVGRRITHSEVYERYDFSGFNMHIGFLYQSGYHALWGGKRKFRIGGVIKTPFDARIRHERRDRGYEYYPESHVWNRYEDPASVNDITLRMPLSCGLGLSMDFTDNFSIAVDIYHTRWDQYALTDPSDGEWSPINREPRQAAGIRPTTQIRLGAEYLFQDPRRIIPIRIGAFYDPEPSKGGADDFYGMSLGSGISYRELFSLDFVYQFRFGKKGNAESILGTEVPGSVAQHYFYMSVIYYWQSLKGSSVFDGNEEEKLMKRPSGFLR